MQQESFELFERLVEEAPERRQALLSAVCPPGDPRREEVLLLLRHDQGAQEATDEAAAAAGDGLEHRAIPGFQLGAAIGSGSTGIVYRARQEHPPRDVALKILAVPAPQARARQRYRSEVQSLARLNHPAIAQLYTAGILEDAVPPCAYLAMELVEGAPLLEAAAAHGLDLERRLRLLVELARAVGHAHERGVAHRDLKPANILLGEEGGALHPKILDFGVARFTDAEAERHSMPSDGGFVGTLAYAAPERLSSAPGHAADPRGDIYALGVVAYELLSGRLPIDVRADPLGTAVQRILHEEPDPLGRRDPALRGDLERVVAHALEKDPERRYARAEAFAADLEAVLQHQPISLRRAERWYRARRWLRRHRLATAAALLALGLLAHGLWLEWRRLRESVAVTAAVSELFAGAWRHLETRTGTTEARAGAVDAWLEVMQPIVDLLPEDPQTLGAFAALLREKSQVERERGAWELALMQRERALALRQRIRELAPSEESLREEALERVLVGDAFWALGRLPTAREHWHAAHAQFVSLAEAYPSRRSLDDLADSLGRLARIAHELGDDAESLLWIERAEHVHRRLFALAPSEPLTLLSRMAHLANFANVLQARRAHAEALVAREEALELVRRLRHMDPEHRLYRRRHAELLADLGADLLQARPDGPFERFDAEAEDLLGAAPDDELEHQAHARLSVLIARVELHRRAPETAERSLQRAFELLSVVAEPMRSFWRRDALGVAIDCAEASGDHTRADAYRRELVEAVLAAATAETAETKNLLDALTLLEQPALARCASPATARGVLERLAASATEGEATRERCRRVLDDLSR